MRRCERCGEHNHDDARYCGTCGVALPEASGIESLVAGGTGPEWDRAPTRGPDADTVPGEGPGGAVPGTSEYVGAPSFGETGPVTGPPAAPIVTGPTTVAPPPPSPRHASDTGWSAASATSGHPTDALAPTGRPPGGPGIAPTAPYGPGAVGTPTSTPAPFTRSTRSASVMIAALAVAAVVIVGGVFILLSSGSGGDETARTADEAATSTTVAAPPTPTGPPPVAVPAETVPPVVVPDSSVPPTVVPGSALDTVVADPALPDPALTTVPPDGVVPPPTEAPIPAPTSPPVPAPTSPPAPTTPPAPTSPPAPTRGPGDLGLTQPILDETCDGRYITFVGSAVGEQPYGPVVEELLRSYPGTNYIWTKACPSLRQEFSTGADIYGVVFGPYATQQEACNAIAFGPVDAYVRRISTFDPPDHTIEC